MNIFFGKISKKVDIQQIEEGYYLSAKGSTWFGEIEIDDYAYIIGGDKIQLWKAREWGNKDGKECLWFDILNKDLSINLNKFTALDFFKLTSALIVLTSRSARNKAFFKLDTIKELSVDYITDSNTYEKSDIYRKTIIHESKNHVKETSIDIQLYYEDGILKLYEADFFDDGVLNNFRDNLKFGGKGAVRKDNVIKRLKSKSLTPSADFTNSEISMRSLYDTLFCEYTEKEKYYVVGASWDGSNPLDQTARFLSESIWENGYDDKFINDVNKVSVGSYIAIKAAFTREKIKSVMVIKARGIVVKNYNNGKNLDVEWEEDFNPFEVDFSGGYWATIHEVKKQNHINAIWNDEPDFNEQNKNDMLKFPLNQILYGPPGTGKTYNTVFKAAQIIQREKEVANYGDALKIFNENLGSQIEFITFHQSYSYEDFIQGLRPDVETKGQLSFEKKDGVFTRIAVNALFEYYKRSKKIKAEKKVDKQKIDENEIYLDYVENLKNLESKDFKSSTGSIISISAFTKNDNVEYKHQNSIRKYLVSGNRLLKLFEVFTDIKQIKNVQTDIRKAIGGCNTTVYWVALKDFIAFYNKYDKSSEVEQDDVYEEVSYESKKKLLATLDLDSLREISAEEVPNYVIIIDEINRANISRVFGELITLIETDKRSHGKIPLSCTLPSGEQFIVPSNLHLIGTMNTADKSIALLDIALRRRFEFVPMYPDYELEYEEKETLKLINERIIELKGYDFQIGHAYFMSDDFELVDCINNKVIPLLLEYFLNDEKEVKGILTKAGLILEENGWPLKIIGK